MHHMNEVHIVHALSYLHYLSCHKIWSQTNCDLLNCACSAALATKHFHKSTVPELKCPRQFLFESVFCQAAHFQRLCCSSSVRLFLLLLLLHVLENVAGKRSILCGSHSRNCPFSNQFHPHSHWLFTILSHILLLDLAREFLISQPQELLSATLSDFLHKSLSCASLILSPVGLSFPHYLGSPLPLAVGKCNTCRMHTIIISSIFQSTSLHFLYFSHLNFRRGIHWGIRGVGALVIS